MYQWIHQAQKCGVSIAYVMYHTGRQTFDHPVIWDIFTDYMDFNEFQWKNNIRIKSLYTKPL